MKRLVIKRGNINSGRFLLYWKDNKANGYKSSNIHQLFDCLLPFVLVCFLYCFFFLLMCVQRPLVGAKEICDYGRLKGIETKKPKWNMNEICDRKVEKLYNKKAKNIHTWAKSKKPIYNMKKIVEKSIMKAH